MREISNLDASLKAITPEGIEFVLFPAGFPVRTLAYAIDKLIQWLILFCIYMVLLFSRFALGIWIYYLLNFVVDWFYHIFFELAFQGQTPGKRLMGIRVIKSDGSPIDPASSFLRNLLRFADTFLSLFHIAFISIAASSGFRRLGDWAGGTLVVYSSMAKNTKRLKKYSAEADIPAERYGHINPQVSLSFGEKQAILDFARRYPLLGEARSNEIAALYAPYLKGENSNMSDSSFLLGIAKKLSGKML